MADVARALAAALGWGLAGAVAWSLAEYALHRWDMHGSRGRGATCREHRRHHATVDVPVITAGTWVGAALVAVFLAAAAHPAAGAGWMAAYVAYELVHRHLHATADTPGAVAGRYGRWARRHHLHHHVVDARANFGVTTPLWDVVLGTRRR